MNWPDDFEIVDGKIIGKKSNEYAVHDRYVTCRKCGVRRPADKMIPFTGVPWCGDHEVQFASPSGWQTGKAEDHNGNAKVQSLPVVPVEVRMPSRQSDTDAPACRTCGDITVRSGSCYACRNCGTTSGCS